MRGSPGRAPRRALCACALGGLARPAGPAEGALWHEPSAPAPRLFLFLLRSEGLTRTQRAGGGRRSRRRPAAGTLRPRRAGVAAARSAAAGSVAPLPADGAGGGLAEDAREEGQDPTGRARGPRGGRARVSCLGGGGRSAGVQAERVSLSACPSPDLGVKPAACSPRALARPSRPGSPGCTRRACQFVTESGRHVTAVALVPGRTRAPGAPHPSTRLGASPYLCGIRVPRHKM